jgi:hypothetical protein
MIKGGEVLRFIHQYKSKFRKCSSEQRGHVYLIVKVDRSSIRLSDGFSKYTVDKASTNVCKVLVDLGPEVVARNKGSPGRDPSGNISGELSLANELKDVGEELVGLGLFSTGKGIDDSFQDGVGLLGVEGKAPGDALHPDAVADGVQCPALDMAREALSHFLRDPLVEREGKDRLDRETLAEHFKGRGLGGAGEGGDEQVIRRR